MLYSTLRPAGSEPVPRSPNSGRAEYRSVQRVVFDPISAFLEGSINVEKHVRNSLGPLTAVAERSGAAIVLVRHLRKTGTRSALHQGVGSIGVIAAVRSGLLVGNAPADNQTSVVAQFKSSLGPIASSLSFGLIENAGGVQVNWHGPCPYSAEQVLAASGGPEMSALEDAAFVLYSVLGDGPVFADEAKRAVLRAGVTERTLRRAKELLMVKSQRVGFGKDSRFYWSLPATSDLVRRLSERDLDQLADALFNSAPKHPPALPPENQGGVPNSFFRLDDVDPQDDDPADWWKRRRP